MLITESYRQLNRALHVKLGNYGISGQDWREYVRPLAQWGRLSVLDYGAGKCTLAQALGPAYKVTNYDPCIVGLEAAPEPHPVVFCGDVLEHIEPDCLADVLADLKRVMLDTGFFVIAIKPSEKTLDDGRNAHLIVEQPEWWAAKLIEAGFDIIQVKPKERTIMTTWFVVKPRKVQ